MDIQYLKKLLLNGNKYDLMMDTNADTSNGWKISIQGKSITDSIFLYEKLHKYLDGYNIPYKIATNKRFMMINKNKEQSHKAFTIYCPNTIDFKHLCEEVYTRIMDYKGWYDIDTPQSYEHYAGGIYFTNDRDETGEYVSSKNRKEPQQ